MTFQRNKVPAFVATRAAFGQRKLVETQTSNAPTHIRAEWTGENRPNGADALARIRAALS